MAENFSKPNRDMSSLYPAFAAKVQAALAEAQAAGLAAHVFEGYRSVDRQAYLYAQGRTRPGAIVTNAKPGTSFHEYGIAVDIVFDAEASKPGVQWTWNGDYARLAPMFRTRGMRWLGDSRTFKELVHFELPTSLGLAEMAELKRKGGVHAVWRALDKQAGGKP